MTLSTTTKLLSLEDGKAFFVCDTNLYFSLSGIGCAPEPDQHKIFSARTPDDGICENLSILKSADLEIGGYYKMILQKDHRLFEGIAPQRNALVCFVKEALGHHGIMIEQELNDMKRLLAEL